MGSAVHTEAQPLGPGLRGTESGAETGHLACFSRKNGDRPAKGFQLRITGQWLGREAGHLSSGKARSTGAVVGGDPRPLPEAPAPETEAEEVRDMTLLPVFVPHAACHAQTGFIATRFFISPGRWGSQLRHGLGWQTGNRTVRALPAAVAASSERRLPRRPPSITLSWFSFWSFSVDPSLWHLSFLLRK